MVGVLESPVPVCLNWEKCSSPASRCMQAYYAAQIPDSEYQYLVLRQDHGNELEPHTTSPQSLDAVVKRNTRVMGKTRQVERMTEIFDAVL